jgi:hypothetical protein
MEGAAKRRVDQVNLATAAAWHTAMFALGGYSGKLKGKQLSDFLVSDERPSEAALSHSRAIAFFHRLKARGADVEITRLN